MKVTFLLLILTVLAIASTGSPSVADSTVSSSKTDTAKAKKVIDTGAKLSVTLPLADSILNSPSFTISSTKPHTGKDTGKKSLPVKKEKKVKEKKKGNFDFGRVLIVLSQKLPSALRVPDELFRSVFTFIKKNTFKVVLLLSFLIIIITATFFFIQRVEGRRFMTTTRLSVMDKEVQRTCRYIENSFDDATLSIDTICTEMVTGKAFLTALFERELGMTVEDFIAQVRINRAKILIKKDSSVDVAVAAQKTGYSDINQFSSTFEKLCGVSIDDYKKSLSSSPDA